MAPQNSSHEQLISKIKHYCGYQERSHAEVKSKLYSFGLHSKDIDEIIAGLIGENYLNEERFAVNFAGGKFRIKHWGKNKIKQSLKLKQVGDYCIKRALKEIDGAEYLKTFKKLSEQKMKLLQGEKNILAKKRKLQNFLLQKGYEISLISEEVKKLDKNKGAKNS